MKTMIASVVLISFLILGCSPSDLPPPLTEATPTAESADQITDMDFESGDMEASQAPAEETDAEPTTVVPED